MRTPIRRPMTTEQRRLLFWARERFGTSTKLASLLGVTQPFISACYSGAKPLPPRRSRQIRRLIARGAA